ncbi:MAG: NUDIX hydrolase [Chlamydia sp. 32-24]|nr:MAG: NUDIX hydrolase [Chlamydia sp. 32-24]
MTTITNNLIRSKIYTLIDQIIPFDAMEEKHITFAKDWINSGVDIFRISQPNIPNIHLVSYFIILDPDTYHFLLVDHKKAKMWLPPGGHVELNEHPKDTVKREIHEELGIEADFLLEEPLFLTLTTIEDDLIPHTDVSLWYVLKANKNQFFIFDKQEFHTIQWFIKEQIPYKKTDPHMQRFIEKLSQKLIP